MMMIPQIEDGVAMSAKAQARKNIVENYSSLINTKDPKTQIGIRVNSVSSNLLLDDLKILLDLNRGQVRTRFS